MNKKIKKLAVVVMAGLLISQNTGWAMSAVEAVAKMNTTFSGAKMMSPGILPLSTLGASGMSEVGADLANLHFNVPLLITERVNNPPPSTWRSAWDTISDVTLSPAKSLQSIFDHDMDGNVDDKSEDSVGNILAAVLLGIPYLAAYCAGFLLASVIMVAISPFVGLFGREKRSTP